MALNYIGDHIIDIMIERRSSIAYMQELTARLAQHKSKYETVLWTHNLDADARSSLAARLNYEHDAYDLMIKLMSAL